MKHLFFGPVLRGFILVNVVYSHAELYTSAIPVKLAPGFRRLPFLTAAAGKPVKLDARIVEAEVSKIIVSAGRARAKTRIRSAISRFRVWNW